MIAAAVCSGGVMEDAKTATGARAGVARAEVATVQVRAVAVMGGVWRVTAVGARVLAI